MQTNAVRCWTQTSLTRARCRSASIRVGVSTTRRVCRAVRRWEKSDALLSTRTSGYIVSGITCEEAGGQITRSSFREDAMRARMYRGICSRGQLRKSGQPSSTPASRQDCELDATRDALFAVVDQPPAWTQNPSQFGSEKMSPPCISASEMRLAEMWSRRMWENGGRA